MLLDAGEDDYSSNHRLATASQDGVMVLLARLGQILSRELYHL